MSFYLIAGTICTLHQAWIARQHFLARQISEPCAAGIGKPTAYPLVAVRGCPWQALDFSSEAIFGHHKPRRLTGKVTGSLGEAGLHDR